MSTIPVHKHTLICVGAPEGSFLVILELAHPA